MHMGILDDDCMPKQPPYTTICEAKNIALLQNGKLRDVLWEERSHTYFAVNVASCIGKMVLHAIKSAVNVFDEIYERNLKQPHRISWQNVPNIRVELPYLHAKVTLTLVCNLLSNLLTTDC
jgi:hypothetical protein